MKNQFLCNLIKKDPKLYVVPFKEFYKTFDHKICEREIENLINRYDIHNKDILSIGSGTAHEEYWFCIKSNNRITLFDIDESGTIEPRLVSMSAESSKPKLHEPSSKSIQYYIGDFLKFKTDFAKQFDVLYLSSFTPDELRRSAIVDSSNRNKRNINWWIKKLVNYFAPSYQKDIHWPSWRTPFHKSVYDSFRLVKSNGLVIIQSYCGGVDVTCNPHYLEKIKQDFFRCSITLLDIFHLKAAPGVSLIVGYFGDTKKAEEFYQKEVHIPLERFHGRTTLNNEAVHLYSLCP